QQRPPNVTCITPRISGDPDGLNKGRTDGLISAGFNASSGSRKIKFELSSSGYPDHRQELINQETSYDQVNSYSQCNTFSRYGGYGTGAGYCARRSSPTAECRYYPVV